MKATLILILYICISLCTYSQTSVQSIYLQGKPINSCEDNLVNLFNNWNTSILTYSDKIELLSYQYVKTIKSKSDINYYLKWSTEPGTLINAFTTSMNSVDGDKITKSLKIHIVSWQNYLKEAAPKIRKGITKEKKKYREAMKKKINIGDKVYVIKGKFKDKDFENYVFCNPSTRRIVWDNMFGLVEF